MAQTFRHFWGQQDSGTFYFWWPIIQHNSVVVVTASEGQASDVAPAPQRFIGSALFTVGGVAPFDGGVSFFVGIGLTTRFPTNATEDFSWGGLLNLWTDITVFEPSELVGTN
jgi:hypothetical protein